MKYKRLHLAIFQRSVFFACYSKTQVGLVQLLYLGESLELFDFNIL